MRSRVFNIMQYAKHPETGKELINEDCITAALEKHKSIKRWAYIAHDRDQYVDKEGTKPLHYHIVIDLGRTTTDSASIAQWFNIPENFVDVPHGYNSFYHCVEYLTHEKCPEKGVYPDEAVRSNFNFREVLNAKTEKSDKLTVDAWISGLMKGNLRLEDCRNMDSVIYIHNLRKLRDAQNEYIASLPVPPLRLNFCITGESSAGKTTLAKALARSLCPEARTAEECYHFVGAKSVAFEGYAGQPVIIWDDCRPLDLLETLGGRDNLFRVLDPHPERALQNIKYGRINIVNQFNIFTTIMSYEEFLDGLAGQYTDKHGMLIKSESRVQSYRRFPIVIQVRLKDFVMLANKGWTEGNSDYLHFSETMRVVASLGQLRSRYEAHGIPAVIAEKHARDKEAEVLVPVISQIKAMTPQPFDENNTYEAEFLAAEAELEAEARQKELEEQIEADMDANDLSLQFKGEVLEGEVVPSPPKEKPIEIRYDLKQIREMTVDEVFFHTLLA